MNDNQIPELPKMNTEVKVDNNNEKKEIIINKKNSTIQFLKDAYKYITSRDSSELLALLWRLLLIAGFIIVLYIPFQLFRDLGINILIMVGVNFNDTILDIWTSIWAIVYGIIAIILFFKICKDRYYKLVNQNENKEIIEENK